MQFLLLSKEEEEEMVEDNDDNNEEEEEDAKDKDVVWCISASFTRPERPKGVKDEVKDARRA